MWELGNRGVILLISVLTGCALIYNAWGPILALVITVFLVIYVCYSLAINDSVLFPHAFLVLDHLRDAAVELKFTLATALVYVTEYAFQIRDNLLGRYRQRFGRMEKRRRSNYQLSTDPSPSRNSPVGRNSTTNTSRSPRFISLLEQLSPITGNVYKEYEDENRIHRESEFGRENQEQFGVITSTPAIHQRHDGRNGDLGRFAAGKTTPRKRSPMYTQNHTLSRGDGDTYFSPAGSPWGNSISPKLRSKAGGVKTVQTVAGPLLASTRYNIDPKVYSDVTSPGLTTRLTKYAAEANGKLTHQAQYGTGQFPKVNLHAGPLPLLNKKAVKNRTPVTVRVAPPEVARYSPPERQRILSKLCQVEDKPPSVVEVLREISLKRHASREEIAADLIKKQRTDGIFTNELEDTEEMNQKRSRDDSSKLEDDISPQSKVIRPAKRTKTPSCYDILNSLSSSINVASGVKRKAIDFSRSGTPDFEKHFKSLESVPTTSVETVTTPQNVALRQKQLGSRENHARENTHKSPSRSPEIIQVKSILKLPGKQSIIVRTEEPGQKPRTHIKTMRTQPENCVTTSAPVNVADKLFMRAERPVNEKLKSLVEEQGHIKAKFTGDDAEEIKKEDIVNMRQTSMRARLQSMFDAISGKAPSRINPDVVIQAEEDTPVAADVPTTCASLNSSTTTTNVNTAPITTSAIAPFGSLAEPNTRQTKHVAFNLPTTQTTNTSGTTEVQKSPSPAEVSKGLNTSLTGSQNGGTSTSLSFPGSSAGPTLSFGKSTTSLAMPTPTIPATTSAVLSFGVSAANVTSSTAAPAPNLPSFGTTSASTPAVSSFYMPKTQTGFGNLSNTATTTRTSTTPSANFSFGNSATNTTSPVTRNVNANPLFASQSGIPSAPAVASTATVSAATSNLLSTTSATSTPPQFSFGNNAATAQTTKSELFSFNTASSTPSNAAPTGTGFGPPTTTTSMLFGPTTTTAYSFMSPNSTATTSTGSFGTTTAASTFGVARTTSIFSFATAKPSVSENKLLFSFNASTVTAATTTPTISSSMSIFGTTSNTTPSFAPPTTSAPAFSTQATSASGFNQPALFSGTPSTSAPAFGTPVTSTSAFGAPGTSASTFGTPTTTNTTFGTPATTATTFGTSVTSASTFSTPTTTAPPQFGQGSTLFGTPSTNTFGTAQPVFGGASTSAAVNTFNTPQTTTSMSVFGSGTTSATKPATTASSLFPNTNTTAVTTSAGTKSVFGSTSGMFAQAKLPTSFGTAATPLFGATSPPVFGSQTSTSAFAANNPTTTAATTANLAFGANTVTTASATLTFGSTSTSAPAFGGQTIGATTQAQNTSTAPTFAGSSSIFGTEASSTPIFGSTSTSTSGGFCSAPSAFGTQNTGTIPFGGTSNPPAFGENRPSPFGAATTSAPAFGAAPATSTTTAPIFGTATSTPAGGMFSFGGGQKPAQLNTTFSFGASGTTSNNNNNAPPPAATPFQFTGGQAKPAPAAGFNFTPPASPSINFNTSGAPTFNAPASGMFSIGSGSTAPRSRNVRQRKPR